MFQLFERKLRILAEEGVGQGDAISSKLFTATLQNVIASLKWENSKMKLLQEDQYLRAAYNIVLPSNNLPKRKQPVEDGQAWENVAFSSPPARGQT